MTEQLALEFAQALPPGLTPIEERAAVVILRRVGEEKALGVKALSVILGVKERTAREVVSRLVVQHGLFILSTTGDPGGYFVPAGPEEARRAIQSLRGRGLKDLRRASVLARNGGLGALAGQLSLACGMAEGEEGP